MNFRLHLAFDIGEIKMPTFNRASKRVEELWRELVG